MHDCRTISNIFHMTRITVFGPSEYSGHRDYKQSPSEYSGPSEYGNYSGYSGLKTCNSQSLDSRNQNPSYSNK